MFNHKKKDILTQNTKKDAKMNIHASKSHLHCIAMHNHQNNWIENVPFPMIKLYRYTATELREHIGAYVCIRIACMSN